MGLNIADSRPVLLSHVLRPEHDHRCHARLHCTLCESLLSAKLSHGKMDCCRKTADGSFRRRSRCYDRGGADLRLQLRVSTLACASRRTILTLAVHTRRKMSSNAAAVHQTAEGSWAPVPRRRSAHESKRRKARRRLVRRRPVASPPAPDAKWEQS